jgi:hypothetical protein
MIILTLVNGGLLIRANFYSLFSLKIQMVFVLQMTINSYPESDHASIKGI